MGLGGESNHGVKQGWVEEKSGLSRASQGVMEGRVKWGWVTRGARVKQGQVCVRNVRDEQGDLKGWCKVGESRAGQW